MAAVDIRLFRKNNMIDYTFNDENLVELFLSLAEAAKNGGISSFALTYVCKDGFMETRAGCKDFTNYKLRSDGILVGLSMLSYQFNKELYENQVKDTVAKYNI